MINLKKSLLLFTYAFGVELLPFLSPKRTQKSMHFYTYRRVPPLDICRKNCKHKIFWKFQKQSHEKSAEFRAFREDLCMIIHRGD